MHANKYARAAHEYLYSIKLSNMLERINPDLKIKIVSDQEPTPEAIDCLAITDEQFRKDFASLNRLLAEDKKIAVILPKTDEDRENEKKRELFIPPMQQLCTMSPDHPIHSDPDIWERAKRAVAQGNGSP